MPFQLFYADYYGREFIECKVIATCAKSSAYVRREYKRTASLFTSGTNVTPTIWQTNK